MVYFFQANATLSIENAELWPILAIFGNLSRIHALFGAPFTGLNSAVVPVKLTNIRWVEVEFTQTDLILAS